jgi:serine protease Do
MRDIDANAQIDMIQTIDQEKPVLAVTYVHQGSQADKMDWPPGELIIKSQRHRGSHPFAELQRNSQAEQRRRRTAGVPQWPDRLFSD